MRLSERIDSINPSAAVELDRVLMQMKDNGENIISFNAGQPDFDTPQNIVCACNKALAEGKTKYTSINGIVELRKAICDKLKKDNNVSYDSEEIVVTTGAKQALYNTVQVLVGKGDEVIIPTPCWVSYTEMVKLAQGVPVLVKTKSDYHLDLEAIEKAITPRTRAMIINTPNNPTGAVYTESELKIIAFLAVKHNFVIISDEVYEKLVYDKNKHFSVASISPEVKSHCVTINGFSKAYSMTGWRIGYLAATHEIAKAVCAIQSHSTSNSTSFVQWAAIEALQGPQDSVEKMRVEFDSRRNYICKVLSEIKGFKIAKPEGSFYVFPDVSYYLGKRTPDGKEIKNTSDLCAYILKETKVAILPGLAFDDMKCIRISYSTSMENLKKGLNSVKKLLETTL